MAPRTRKSRQLQAIAQDAMSQSQISLQGSQNADVNRGSNGQSGASVTSPAGHSLGEFEHA